MEWDDLKHVAALWESGSVRRAGAQLGLHGATVARHIERLRDDPELALRLARKAYRTARAHTWDRLAARIVRAAEPRVRTRRR